MGKIVIDAVLREKLQTVTQPVELCDESGQVLGRYIPALDLSQYEPWEPQISEEELQRREKSEKWYTTAEVLAHLKSLEEK